LSSLLRGLPAANLQHVQHPGHRRRRTYPAPTCTFRRVAHYARFAPREKLRDVNFDEDRSQIRTASGPPGHGHLAITILRLAGHASIAAALRHHARRPERPLRTIMKC
jgi:hypothetical protein